jgi:hypothetical protein
MIGLVTATGGTLALLSTGKFGQSGDAFWWAFLRLTDPGYLGDDEGLCLRIISTTLTILGYVLFMGSLIAILTQWLNQTINKLEKGLTPISKNNHVVILGWTAHTPLIVQELVLGGGRVKRFLRKHGSRELTVAILSENSGQEERLELRNLLGDEWEEGQILFRTGSPLKLEHLKRVDIEHAAAIILPNPELRQESIEVSDARSLKALLSLSMSFNLSKCPFAVAEIFDAQKIALAESTYAGHCEIVASEAVISQLLFQIVRNPGVSLITRELLSHGRGNALYVKDFPQFAGSSFKDVALLFAQSIVLGVLRLEQGDLVPQLNPAADTILKEDDKLIFIARDYKDISPDYAEPEDSPAQTLQKTNYCLTPRKHSKILCLGWNSMMPFFIKIVDNSFAQGIELDVFSKISEQSRTRQMYKHGISNNRLILRHLEGDFNVPADLAGVDLFSYDNILILGPDWMESTEDADARTILGLQLVMGVLQAAEKRPSIVVEIFDPENQALIDNPDTEIIVSPVILSHIVAHVALRPELNPVFHELFGSYGSEISFCYAKKYNLQDQRLNFLDIQKIVAEEGEIALGVFGAGVLEGAEKLKLNPSRTETLTLEADDRVIVLTKKQA